MKKKILINLAIICIIFGGAFNAYAQVSLFSGGRVQLSVYAADNTPIWEPVNQNDLVSAFRYYCKSRNVVLEGSIADAITNFTTGTFNSICNTLGIDITLLQAELKKTYNNNLGQRFLFTHTGISLYNRIFAEFLQNNDLSVGDDVSNKIVYSGKYFTDEDGNKCNVYIVDSDISRSGNQHTPIEIGSAYKYTYKELQSLVGTDVVFNVNNNLHITNHIYSISFQYINPYISFETTNSTSNEFQSLICAYGLGTGGFPQGLIRSGNRAIIYNSSTNKLYFGHFLTLYNRSDDNPTTSGYYWRCLNEITDTTDDVDVEVNTPNNTVINNNTYNNNYTIIYNDGDYYEDDGDDEPSPDTPPSGGGGGGGGGDDPDPDEPIVDPTPTPDPHIPDWDIELPDMPTGSEWLLYGMEKKFPWDIPYNLMFMLSLFAAEPETPHFVGTLDLKICQWNYDIDLEPFDNIARYVRDFEFIGFLIGLMLITRKLIWG